MPSYLKEKPFRCARYLKEVAELGCCICGGFSCAHHLIGTGHGSMGGKASDKDTMPLCYNHHTGNLGIHKLTIPEWESRFGKQEHHIERTKYLLNKGIT